MTARRRMPSTCAISTARATLVRALITASAAASVIPMAMGLASGVAVAAIAAAAHVRVGETHEQPLSAIGAVAVAICPWIATGQFVCTAHAATMRVIILRAGAEGRATCLRALHCRRLRQRRVLRGRQQPHFLV